MPSVVRPRSQFPVYSSANPPTTDVGLFTIGKTGVDLKSAGTTTIFTVPTGRTFLCTGVAILVTAVNTGGSGSQVGVVKESSSARVMTTAFTSTAGTPVANQSVFFSIPNSVSTAAWSTCTAGNSVQWVNNASHAGSTAVTGTIWVTGFYSS